MFSEAKGALLRAVLDGNHVVVPAAHVGRARGLAWGGSGLGLGFTVRVGVRVYG